MKEAKAFRHLWGYPITSDATYRQIREDGYDGIEFGLLASQRADDYRDALRQHGLEFIGQVYTAEFTKGHSVKEHLASLEAEVEKLLPLEPVLINAHSGEDTWTLAEMHDYFENAAKLQRRWSVPIAHETHRGRCLYHPTVTRLILEAHPEIQLVADLSHWVCVCERLLEDQPATVAQAAERTVHVHARMGYSQGPQVSDPRSDQFAAEAPPSSRGGGRCSTQCGGAGCRRSRSVPNTARRPTCPCCHSPQRRSPTSSPFATGRPSGFASWYGSGSERTWCGRPACKCRDSSRVRRAAGAAPTPRGPATYRRQARRPHHGFVALVNSHESTLYLPTYIRRRFSRPFYRRLPRTNSRRFDSLRSARPTGRL